MFNPQHVQNGKLVPAAITVRDLRSSGFSVHRMAHVPAADIKKSVAERLARPRRDSPWKSAGVAKMVAGEIRRLRIDDRQALVVIDTAQENNPGHASLYAADPCRGDAHARELRALLLPLLQPRMTVDEAYQF